MGEMSQVGVEMGSGATTHLRSFIKIGSGIQKLNKGHTQTHRERDALRLPVVLQNKENKLTTDATSD
jgi:hypothetical protein